MDNVYIILTEENSVINAKGYYSFSRLCSENGIVKNSIDKKSLPVQVGKTKIFKVNIDTRI